MSDQDTQSELFTLMVKNDPNRKVYEDRHVNMVFEKRMLNLFKVVPPAVGMIINIEKRFVIDMIEYKNTKVVFYIHPASFDLR